MSPIQYPDGPWSDDAINKVKHPSKATRRIIRLPKENCGIALFVQVASTPRPESIHSAADSGLGFKGFVDCPKVWGRRPPPDNYKPFAWLPSFYVAQAIDQLRKNYSRFRGNNKEDLVGMNPCLEGLLARRVERLGTPL